MASEIITKFKLNIKDNASESIGVFNHSKLKLNIIGNRHLLKQIEKSIHEAINTYYERNA